MNLKASLIIEYITPQSILICSSGPNDDIPFCPIDKDPKECAASLLEEITSIKIDPHIMDWLTLELVDIHYDNSDEVGTVYIIYVCRVGEKLPLKEGCQWSDFMTMKPKLDKIKGLI